MGDPKHKQKPLKRGEEVGPKLLRFLDHFQFEMTDRKHKNQTYTEIINTVFDDLRNRVDLGKEKYGQYLYTDDGISKYQQISEELDDAIHYAFSNLVKYSNNETPDVMYNSKEHEAISMKLFILEYFLSEDVCKKIENKEGAIYYCIKDTLDTGDYN